MWLWTYTLTEPKEEGAPKGEAGVERAPNEPEAAEEAPKGAEDELAPKCKAEEPVEAPKGVEEGPVVAPKGVAAGPLAATKGVLAAARFIRGSKPYRSCYYRNYWFFILLSVHFKTTYLRSSYGYQNEEGFRVISITTRTRASN